jgi:hypothetical protein
MYLENEIMQLAAVMKKIFEHREYKTKCNKIYSEANTNH